MNDLSSLSSRELLRRVRTGDDDAARVVFDRYIQRLIGLARRRISPALRRRIDPEDVVQSAYRSFFFHAQDGDYILDRAGDLWRLLASITLHKLHSQVEFHTAEKRSIHGESPLTPFAAEGAARDPQPTAAQASELIEQLQRAMVKLSPGERTALELRLSGRTIEQIAGELGRSERTTRRFLQNARRLLEEKLRGVAGGDRQDKSAP